MANKTRNFHFFMSTYFLSAISISFFIVCAVYKDTVKSAGLPASQSGSLIFLTYIPSSVVAAALRPTLTPSHPNWSKSSKQTKYIFQRKSCILGDKEWTNSFASFPKNDWLHLFSYCSESCPDWICGETEGRDAGKTLGKQKDKHLLFIPETDGFSSTARVSTD